MEKKKIIIVSLICVAVVAIIIIMGIAVFNNSAKVEDGNQIQTEQSKYTWPDLTEYNIPNLEKGFITKLEDDSNKNEYGLNYTIELKNIKKSDLQEYTNKFDSTWQISENENLILAMLVTRTTKYSVYIDCDEQNETAKITITSL